MAFLVVICSMGILSVDPVPLPTGVHDWEGWDTAAGRAAPRALCGGGTTRGLAAEVTVVIAANKGGQLGVGKDSSEAAGIGGQLEQLGALLFPGSCSCGRGGRVHVASRAGTQTNNGWFLCNYC